MASQKTLEHYLRQVRLIEEHREKWCEQNVRRHYRDLMTDLQEFLGVEYAKLAQDDKLTYEILHSKGQYARFLEEIERKTSYFNEKVSQQIRETVQLTYQKTYEGMVDAVEKSKNYEELKINLKGIKAVTPDIIKNAVSNTFLEDALKKNHQNVIYDIKQQIGVGLSQGDRMSTMARRISEQLDKDYKKAVQIARTETHRIREAGYQDSSERISQKLKDSDSDYVMVKIWKTMRDGAVRPQRLKGKKGKKQVVMGTGPNHMKMHGVVALVDDLFDLGDGAKAKAPGQSGVAGHDINCRCYLSRDLMTKAEYAKISGTMVEDFDPAAKYEHKEEELLNNKTDLVAQRDKLTQNKANLENTQYNGIWKDTVTPADYEAKKSSIVAKRQYFEDDILAAQNRTGKYANTTWYSDNDLKAVIAKDKDYLKMLDDFEAQGKQYLKIAKNLSDIDGKLSDIDDQVKAVRQKIMKIKGIDPEKMQSEIDDLVMEINKLASSNKTLSLKSKIGDFHGGEIDTVMSKIAPDMHYNDNLWKDEVVKDFIEFGLTPEQQTEFKKELKKLIKNNPEEAAKLKKLQKELAAKSDELEKIRKRYGLAEDKFSQARKDGAYWFTDQNGGARAADGVLRDKCGEIWQKATAAQKKTAYEYTQSYHKYNEPLRGIEYGTSKFVGVGKIDLENIGVSTYGMKKGQVKKLIDDLTDVIDKSSYDFDMWVQRGCGYGGMDKFFNVSPDDFYNLSQEEMQAKLLGTTPTEFAFMSTGVAKGRGLNISGQGITLNIFAPKGTNMLYCEPFSAFGQGDGRTWDGKSKQSSFGHEAEILLQRNTKFRVTKVEKSGSRWFIDMDIIDQKR